MNEPVRIELPTTFGMNTVNSYLIKDSWTTLIDCGENTPASWQALTKGLAREGLTIQDIDRLIITHAHVDHIGMAQRVAEKSGAKVWVNKFSLKWAIDVDEQRGRRGRIIERIIIDFFDADMARNMLESLKSLMANMKDLWQPIPRKAIHVYDMEGSIQIGGEPWQILYVPGHTNSQTCFYNSETQQLFSADMLLRVTPTPVLEEDPDRPGYRDAGILKLLASYEKLRRMEVSTVYPGHYDVFTNANKIIHDQVQRIHKRKEECWNLVEAGYSQIEKIYARMYKDKWFLPAFNMLIGYLDLLEYEGRIHYKMTENIKLILPLESTK